MWSPQYSLWLVPLAVLALPRWGLLLGWMVVDALVWVPRMFYYLTPAAKGLPPDWFLGAVLARDAMVVLLCVLVVRSVLRPATDPVRILGMDDPDWPPPRTRHVQRPGAARAVVGRAASPRPCRRSVRADRSGIGPGMGPRPGRELPPS